MHKITQKSDQKQENSFVFLQETPCILTKTTGERLVGIVTYYPVQKSVFLRHATKPMGQKIPTKQIKEIITK